MTHPEKRLLYTVEETVPEGYEESYDGNNITNTLTDTDATLVDVSGTKTWVDYSNAAEPVRRM